MIGLGSEVYSCAPAPVQVAGLRAYELDGDLHDYLAGQRQILRTIGQQIHQALVAAGIHVHPPEGAFYLLLDFSPFADKFKSMGIETDSQLCEQLIDDIGVALLPGTSFGLSSDAFTARLAYVDFDGASALDNLKQDGDISSRDYAQKMLDGIQLLDNWLNS